MRHRSGATILRKPLPVSNDLGAYRGRCACVRRVAGPSRDIVRVKNGEQVRERYRTMVYENP